VGQVIYVDFRRRRRSAPTPVQYERPRCSGKTNAGIDCTIFVTSSGDYCRWHKDQELKQAR
jgi:hypothetical protein